MKIGLTLSDDGPPFFLLGDPKNLIFSLTYNDPGPVYIEFSQINLNDQKTIIYNIQRGILECDISIGDLYHEYEKLFSKEAPVRIESDEPKTVPAGAISHTVVPQDRTEKEEKFQEKCQKLVKENVSALKKKLKNENDLRTLRTVRDLELSKRSPRTSVVDLINLKLRKLESGIIAEIGNDDNVITLEADLPQESETFVSSVIESDKEIVQLTPEMLIGYMAK